MAVSTAVDFKKEVDKLFRHFDRQEHDALEAMFADDGQGVDEISKGWIRGRANMKNYFSQMAEMGVSDIHSKTSDHHVLHWDDVALVTLVLDESYKAGGESVTIKAPMSVLFRRIGSDWKIQLVHAVPLADD